MAFVGLANPYIARLVDEATKKYADCFMCGEAITVNVTPNYNTAKLHSNNRLSDVMREFKDGSITLGTDRLPAKASEVCFGHEVGEEGRRVTYRTGDDGVFVGVGFYVDERVDGKTKYTATVVYKAKFSESANEYNTKGENIEFKTPVMDGDIAGLKTGEWKDTYTFDTKAEADKWLRDTLGYEEEAVDVPPVVDDKKDQENQPETSGGEDQENQPETSGLTE